METEHNGNRYVKELMDCTNVIGGLLHESSSQLEDRRVGLHRKVETFYSNRYAPRRIGEFIRETEEGRIRKYVKEILIEIQRKREHIQTLRRKKEILSTEIMDEMRYNNRLSEMKKEYIDARIDLGTEEVNAAEMYLERSRLSDQSRLVGWTELSNFELTDEESHDLAIVILEGRDKSCILGKY